MKRSFGKKSMLFYALAFLLTTGLAMPVYSMPILSGSNGGSGLWTASDSEGRSASAQFSIEVIPDGGGYKLNILLTNTAALVDVPNEVLAGLFFDFGGALSDPHVEVAVGSLLLGDGSPQGAGTSLDSKYAYLSDINGINGGLGYYGISSTGFDPEPGAPIGWKGFGADDIIDGSNNSPNGSSYGLVGSAVGHPVSASPYVQQAVLISLGLSGNPDEWLVGQVNFLYGTDYSGTPIPEPATIILVGSGLLGLGRFARKRFKKS